jgi:hypothetical protein
MNWSASRLATAQRCLHQYYLKYVKKDYRDSGPAAKRGLAVHHASKEVHKRQVILRAQEDNEFLKRISIVKGITPEQLYDSAAENVPDGGDASREEARTLAADNFEEEWKKGTKLKPDEKKRWKEVKAEFKDAAVNMAGAYVGDIAPYITPIGVETKVEVTPKEADFSINGRLDLLEEDLEDLEIYLDKNEDHKYPVSDEVIRDLKTKDKKPYKFVEEDLSDDGLVHYGTGPDADNSSQLTMYNLLRLGHTKKLPKGSRMTTVVETPKAKNLDIYVMDTTRDVTDVRMLIKRIQVATDAVEKGIFVPADPAMAGSPCSWCDYSADGTCEFYRRKKQ